MRKVHLHEDKFHPQRLAWLLISFRSPPPNIILKIEPPQGKRKNKKTRAYMLITTHNAFSDLWAPILSYYGTRMIDNLRNILFVREYLSATNFVNIIHGD